MLSQFCLSINIINNFGHAGDIGSVQYGRRSRYDDLEGGDCVVECGKYGRSEGGK